MNIQAIADKLQKMMEAVRLPVFAIPAVMLLCSILKRPGTSAMLAAANTIQDVSEFGPTGPMPDGSENLMNKYSFCLCKNIEKDIKRNGVVQIAIPPGAIQVEVRAGNGGGPIVGIGSNINSPVGWGMIH